MKLPSWFLGAALAAAPVAARAEVLIERTILPFEAGPSSFAIGLPGGVNFCFDAVRGGVSYVWTGGFLDLKSVRPGMGKNISAAKLLGPVVYEEKGAAPLRRGDAARVPVVEFKGYTLHEASIEFRYSIDGIMVREEISARPDRTALVRRFSIEPVGADSQWWHVTADRPPAALRRDSTGALVVEHLFSPAAP